MVVRAFDGEILPSTGGSELMNKRRPELSVIEAICAFTGCVQTTRPIRATDIRAGVRSFMGR
jgi:hypothetical protein